MCLIDSINFDTDTVDTNRRIVILADEIQRVVAAPNCSTMISSLFEKSSLASYPSAHHLIDSFVEKMNEFKHGGNNSFFNWSFFFSKC
jgi:hypothetical protein